MFYNVFCKALCLDDLIGYVILSCILMCKDYLFYCKNWLNLAINNNMWKSILTVLYLNHKVTLWQFFVNVDIFVRQINFFWTIDTFIHEVCFWMIIMWWVNYQCSTFSLIGNPFLKIIIHSCSLGGGGGEYWEHMLKNSLRYSQKCLVLGYQDKMLYLPIM